MRAFWAVIILLALNGAEVQARDTGALSFCTKFFDRILFRNPRQVGAAEVPHVLENPLPRSSLYRVEVQGPSNSIEQRWVMIFDPLAGHEASGNSEHGILAEAAAAIPRWAKKYRVSNTSDGHLGVPTHSALDKIVLDLRSKGDPLASNLNFWHPKKGGSNLTFAQKLVKERAVPLARDESEFFHDLRFHLFGYTLLPKEVVDRMVSRFELLLRVLDQPQFSTDPALRAAIMEVIDSEVKHIDVDTFFIGHTLFTNQIGDSRFANALSSAFSKLGRGTESLSSSIRDWTFKTSSAPGQSSAYAGQSLRSVLGEAKYKELSDFLSKNSGLSDLSTTEARDMASELYKNLGGH